MPIGEGRKSYIQFGLESTWGTGVAATNRLEVISMDVAPDQGIILDPSLNNSVGRRGLFQGGRVYRGTFLVRLTYQGMLKLFKALFGVTWTPTVVEGAVSWDHIIHDQLAQLTVHSLTIEMIEGDIGTGLCQRLLGTVITSLTVRAVAGQGQDAMLQAEFEVLAKEKETGATPTGALSFPSILPALYHHALTIDDGVNVSGNNVRSIEVRYEAPHAADRFYLGTVNPAEFIRDDFVKATYKFSQDFQNITALANLKSFANASPQLIFRGGALGANFYEFEMKSDKAVVARQSTPVAGYGVITMETTIEAYHDATLGTFYCRFRNGESAI
jgi:tail tube protein